MAYITTVYPKSVTWNSETWDRENDGGLLQVSLTHGGRDIQDRTGTQEYPMFVVVVDKFLVIRVTLREVKQIFALQTKSNMSIMLEGKSGTTVPITAPGMVLVNVDPSQGRAEPGFVTLTFVHESADGVTVPIS